MRAVDPDIPKGLARSITRSVINSFIEDGRIDPRNKTEHEILAELAQMLPRIEFVPIVDHTDAWLRKARNPQLAGDGGFSVVCYATWAEHMLNKMVFSLCTRHRVNPSICQSLIRHTRTAEKFIWLSLVLTSKAPSKRHLERLQRIAETRNHYLHYKWKPKPEEHEQKLKTLIRDGERLVATLREFLNAHFYRGHRRRLQSMLKSRPHKLSKGSNQTGT